MVPTIAIGQNAGMPDRGEDLSTRETGTKAVAPGPMPRDKGGWQVAPAPDGRGTPEQHLPRPPHRLRGFWIFVLVLLAVNWISVLAFQPPGQSRVTVPFSPFFLNELQAGQVKSINSKGDTIQGTFKTKLRYPPTDKKATATTLFSTQIPAFWNNAQVASLLRAQRVQVNAQSTTQTQSLLAEILLGFGPTLLIVGLFVLIARRAQSAAGSGMGALGNFGRSQARRVDPEKIRVTFDDVAGIDEAKNELTEIVDFLRDPAPYERLGGRMPHGVLLSGPPGRARRCSRARSRARRTPRSSRLRHRSSSRRSSGSGHRGCVTCSRRRRRRPPRSSSSTSSTPSAARGRARSR